MKHDSQNEAYRSPFGALPCGEALTLTLETPVREGRIARLHLYGHPTETCLAGTALPRGETVAWQFCLTAPEEAGLFWYDFEVVDPDASCWYGAPEDGLGGSGVLRPAHGAAWQVTVYERLPLPAWPGDGIMYQVYVDRFFNGDPRGRIENAPAGALLHAHWEDTPVYIRDEKKNVIRWDFFGGNLQGVEAKLDRLQQMGVTILYLNPIFLSPSNHKYDTADYRRIDPMYGGEAAFDSLVRALKARGMHLLLDGVFSHTGSDSVYFNRYGHYDGPGAYQSQGSPYFGWYRFARWPDKYECWWGVENMPNVDELHPGYLAYQLHDADSTVRHWMRRGIDGFRLDVADELPDAFLRQLKQVIREEKTDAFLLGEVWEDASNKVSYDVRRQYFMGRELDSVTNYPLRSALLALLLGRMTAPEMARRMRSLQENYPPEQFYSLMNMTGTHDTARLVTLLGEAPDPEGMTEEGRGAYRLPAEQRALALRRLALFAAVLFTHPGIPTVYYGDEAGMEGYTDPFNRGTYPWGREDMTALALFREMGILRRSEPTLRRGSYIPLAPAEDVYGHWRQGEDAAILTLIHPTDTPCEVFLPAVGLGEILWQRDQLGSTLRPVREGYAVSFRGMDALIVKLSRKERE